MDSAKENFDCNYEHKKVVNKVIRGTHTKGGIGTNENDNEMSTESKLCTKDEVHHPISSEDRISTRQVYATDSGNLFHAGRILITLVGLPATSKTLLAVAIARYTKWVGVRTKSFHASEYKRNDTSNNISNDSLIMSDDEKEVVGDVLNDIKLFFNEYNGQIAIYDALNIQKESRKALMEAFQEINVKTLYIESIITDPGLVQRNIELAINSDNYTNWKRKDAMEYYNKQLLINESKYDKITNREGICFLKYINFGQQIIIGNQNFGYLINKIVFFLMNLRHKTSRVFLARCGTSNFDRYTDDELLNEEGVAYSRKLADMIFKRIKEKNENQNLDPKSLEVWTGPRKRTYDTGMFFMEAGVSVVERSRLKQLIPGSVADLTPNEIKEKFPKEYAEYLKDPSHYRYPRAESYHDLAVRMEPLILELEHLKKDIVIIAHDSILQVLYGYLLACNVLEIPTLKFTRNQITEITFGPFCNTVERIPINL